MCRLLSLGRLYGGQSVIRFPDAFIHRAGYRQADLGHRRL